MAEAAPQAEAALRLSEQQYRVVVEGVRDYAIFTLDGDNRVSSWNPGAQRIMGFSEAEAVGQSGGFIFTPEDRRKGEVEREFRQALAEGRAEDERWHLRRDGSRFWASGILMALREPPEDPSGRLLGLVKILRDNTRRKQMEDELRGLNESLEERVSQRTAEMVQYQRQLRSLAAELARTEQRERGRLAEQLHDHLAQTLAVCKMKLSSLRKAIAPTASADAAGSRAGGAGTGLVQAADDLRDLLQDALGYTRTLISDLRPAVLSENDLPAAVEWVAERMHRQHGLRVRVRDDGRPKPLDGDALTSLFQSVRELLFNVLKHAGVDEATVSLSHLSRPRPSVMVEVSDRGRGFDPANRRLVPTEDGGFGLFSIRERIDLMGGRVDVASSPGKGTRVALTVPLKKTVAGPKVNAPSQQQPQPVPVAPREKKRRVSKERLGAPAKLTKR